MGQLVEWPEVITEGATIEECRECLADADHRVAYKECGKPIPDGSHDALFERISVNVG